MAKLYMGGKRVYVSKSTYQKYKAGEMTKEEAAGSKDRVNELLQTWEEAINERREQLNSKEYMRANRPGEFALKNPEEAAQGFQNRTKLQSKILGEFVENRNVIRELEANIRAQKAYNPNAKVGDTRIDSDRMISLYSERLTPQEYSVFTQDAAETALFRKLRELERKAGFKK